MILIPSLIVTFYNSALKQKPCPEHLFSVYCILILFWPLYYNGSSEAFRQEEHEWSLCLRVTHFFLLPPSCYVYRYFVCKCICVLQVFLVPRKASKGHQIPWDESSRQLWVNIWVLKIKRGSSNWAISPTTAFMFSILQYSKQMTLSG